MNRDLTLVFSSYQSHYLLKKILKQFYKKYEIIIVENSCDFKVKEFLKKKFPRLKIIIPTKNLGLAASYNLGIREAKTKFVFLNNPDLKISNNSIKQLRECAKKIKNFGILSPVYKNEKIFKNYEIFKKNKKLLSPVGKKFDLNEVDLIDNSFFINRKKILKNKFDENYFLYFETFDFSRNLKKNGHNLYIAKKIKFYHFGSRSIPRKYQNLIDKTRAFHYNWSKFYYYKKNYNYFFAIKKIIPNIIKAIKKLFLCLLKIDFYNFNLTLIELKGIFYSLAGFKSFYRPKN